VVDLAAGLNGMPIKRVITSLFGTITGLMMLLNFKANGSTATSAPSAITPTGPDSGSTRATSTPSTSNSTSSASSASTSKTIIGDLIDARWGPVQVRITVLLVGMLR
jgi:hypothetical protein